MENVVILGSGIAGLTAAIYNARANLKPIVVSGKEEGGQLMLTTTVENYPGFPEGVQGPELVSMMREQAKKFGTRFIDGDVEKVEVKGKTFVTTHSEGKIESKTVVIATGASARMLGLDSEKKYMARGVHTCATCLPGNVYVVANSSPKQINRIKIGDRVLTHNGSFQKVVNVASRHYKGNLIKVEPRYFHEEPTFLTPNHPILVTTLDRGIGANYGKLKWGKQKWLPAGQLNKKHILLYPIVTETKDYGPIQLSEFLELPSDDSEQVHFNHETHTSRRITNIIELDYDFMRLVGYFLADGTITRRGINFYFGPKDNAYVEDVVKIIKKIFNYEARIKKEGSVYRIECYAGVLRDFFERLVGKYSYGKSLPHWFTYLPKDKQAELLKGFWRGDGGIKKQGFSLVTNSPKLVTQFKMMLLRLGIIPTIIKQSKERLNKTKNIFKGREIKFKHDRYEIEIGGSWLKRASEIFNVAHPLLKSRKRSHVFGWIKEGFAYLPISKLYKEKYEGEVYNLAVENSNSYVTSGAAVHNCDGYFYKDKEIVVVGGGDSAMEESLFLTKHAAKITIVHRRDTFRASKIMQDRVLNNKKIEVMWDSSVEEVLGNGTKVNGIKIKNVKTNEVTERKIDGMFLAIGHIPNTKFLGKLVETNELGFIETTRTLTNVPGLFACGDVQDPIYKQAVTAAGTGCQAAIEAEKYLEE